MALGSISSRSGAVRVATQLVPIVEQFAR